MIKLSVVLVFFVFMGCKTKSSKSSSMVQSAEEPVGPGSPWGQQCPAFESAVSKTTGQIELKSVEKGHLDVRFSGDQYPGSLYVKCNFLIADLGEYCSSDVGSPGRKNVIQKSFQFPTSLAINNFFGIHPVQISGFDNSLTVIQDSKVNLNDQCLEILEKNRAEIDFQYKSNCCQTECYKACGGLIGACHEKSCLEKKPLIAVKLTDPPLSSEEIIKARCLELVGEHKSDIAYVLENRRKFRGSADAKDPVNRFEGPHTRFDGTALKKAYKFKCENLDDFDDFEGMKAKISK